MSATDGDMTNVLAHLSRQDTEMHRMLTMLEEAIADGHALRGDHDALTTRVTGLEARMTLREQHDQRVDRAIAIQLRVSDWWANSKARVLLGTALIPIIVAIFSALLQVILRAFGWL